MTAPQGPLQGIGQAVGAFEGCKMDVSSCDGCSPSLAICLTTFLASQGAAATGLWEAEGVPFVLGTGVVCQGTGRGPNVD